MHNSIFLHFQLFYNMSSVIGQSLSTFCAGMKNNPIAYDLVFLHTGYVYTVQAYEYHHNSQEDALLLLVESWEKYF